MFSISLWDTDHKVKIWNFELVVKDGPEGAVKLFAAMEGHGGPVNCVRFSPDGRFLATASDDHMVLLWELRATAAVPVFGSEDTNVENWTRSLTLSGHTTRNFLALCPRTDTYLHRNDPLSG